MAAIHLHLLRHADAGDPMAWRGDDAVRPLSPKGVGQVERLAEHLAGTRFKPDLILTSPKVRARQTAELVAERLGAEVAIDDRLAGGLTLDSVDALLHAHGDPHDPVLVGHDPDFSELLSLLVGADLSMKKATFARLEVSRPLAAGEALLQWLIPPDGLPKR